MLAPSIEPHLPGPEPASGLVLRLGLRFGVGLGMLCALWMLGLQLTGNNAFGPKLILAQLLVPMGAVGSEWVLRRQLKPEKPGLSRSLGVGGLTVLVAALVSAASLTGLAHGVGGAGLARHRAEVLEIVRAQQRANPQSGLSEQQKQEQMRNVEQLTVEKMAIGNFTQVLFLGLALALPAGIFLRE